VILLTQPLENTEFSANLVKRQYFIKIYLKPLNCPFCIIPFKIRTNNTNTLETPMVKNEYMRMPDYTRNGDIGGLSFFFGSD